MKKDEFFVFYNKRKCFQVLFDDIIYIEAFGRKKILHTEDKSYDINSSIEGIRTKLNSDFIQPHNSFFVNTNYIKDINKNELILKNGIIIPVSRRFKKNLSNSS